MKVSYQKLDDNIVSYGLEKLVGHKVIDMSVEEDKTLLTFICDICILKYRAVGDCCSESWFEHVDIITPGETITKAFPKSIIDMSYSDFYESMQQYFYEIITDKASYTIEMRNENNGFYGGWLELVFEENYSQEV